MGAADVPPFARLLLGALPDCDPESLGAGGGESMMAGGGQESQETSGGISLCPAEEAYKNWLHAHILEPAPRDDALRIPEPRKAEGG